MDLAPIIYYLQRVGSYDPLVVVIEFVLIGSIIWWVVNFLEGTRGERLFRGVFFILLAGAIILKLFVERFSLERVEFLYNGFLLAILVTAVAAFQPELRRALIRIGQAGISPSARPDVERALEEVLIAVNNLSEQKTGAIIVFEGRVGLRDYIETGVRMDAAVSSQLLETIFYEGTPLHDLAVIIRGDRIVAGSIQLPLAEIGSLDDSQLGSRHRAAVGISQASDATALVVSEETGTISLAVDGKLERNVKKTEIKKQIAELNKPFTGKGGSVKRGKRQ
ncbi:DisA bacterial checkpoint controller nucleotide-binding protein [Sedimentisphaera cyanobacteriorum]|uniref:Diadenylate cyclase n=1 Tax=Sedimentisphaera cyanobacteriorum TaxID=1940790 RepID=A0A1Q2HSB5_9BACT|nr:diadenylate cyclase CdaA [Sedimentisphaera cyanobacteriorum]AQQ10349.1 DisA bacterial checkpoint controller nucleotide-binding protein [Sedimentisphaera cyanobacteriorum]